MFQVVSFLHVHVSPLETRTHFSCPPNVTTAQAVPKKMCQSPQPCVTFGNMIFMVRSLPHAGGPLSVGCLFCDCQHNTHAATLHLTLMPKAPDL